MPPYWLKPIFLLELNPCDTLPSVSDFKSISLVSFILVIEPFTLTSVTPSPVIYNFLTNLLNLSNCCLPFLLDRIPSQFLNKNIVLHFFSSFRSSPHVMMSSLLHFLCCPIERTHVELFPPDWLGAWFLQKAPHLVPRVAFLIL